MVSVPWWAIGLVAAVSAASIAVQAHARATDGTRAGGVEVRWVAVGAQFAVLAALGARLVVGPVRAGRLMRRVRDAGGCACPGCGYVVGEGVACASCPECGAPYSAERARAAWEAVGPGWYQRARR